MKKIVYYKYMSLETAKLVLNNLNLKITNPIDFNDPFDCIFPAYMDTKFIKKNLQNILKRIPEFKNMYKISLENNYNIQDEIEELQKEIKKDLNKMLDDIRLNEWNKVISNHRILCLSTDKDNILMWSHYADQHKGIVLGFDFSHDEKHYNNIKKVEYGSNKIKIFAEKILNLLFQYLFKNHKEILTDDISNKVDKIFSNKIVENYFIKIFYENIVEYFWIKNEIWKYENEYRLVVSQNDFNKDLITFNKTSLTEIVIGLKCNLNNEDEFERLLKSFENTRISFAKESHGRLLISKNK